MKYLLGIDFGGGASKATLLGADGVIAAENTVEYPTLHPSPDACEQDPRDWIDALKQNTAALFRKSGARPADILAVALDAATHSSLLCDGDFRPLRNAMFWTDTRSRRQAAELLQTRGDEIFAKTNHRPDPIWTLPQLLWLRRSEPEIFAKAKYLFFEKDYLRRYLAGDYGTDCIEAEGSMFFDCNKMTWDGDLCRAAGLSPDMLPPVRKPTDVVGAVTQAAAAETGLAAGTPVVCGTTDTVLEVFASGAVARGDVTVKLATAGRICVITDRPYPDRHLVNYSHVAAGLWYPGTATKSCASSFRWYRDTFGGDYKELDRAAKDVPPGCDGLLFHPYLNGELTPYADPDLCGSFTGIRITHTKAHFTRALLEGVAFSLLDSKRYLDGLGIPHASVATVIGGGAKSALWRQITADVLGMTLQTTTSGDSSLGAAMLAGVATGVFSDVSDAVRKCVREKEITEPHPENTETYAGIFEVYKKIHDALAPVYRERKK